MKLDNFNKIGELEEKLSSLNKKHREILTEYKTGVIGKDKEIIKDYFNKRSIELLGYDDEFNASAGSNSITVKFSKASDLFLGATVRYEIKNYSGNVTERYVIKGLLTGIDDDVVQNTHKSSNQLEQADDSRVHDLTESIKTVEGYIKKFKADSPKIIMKYILTPTLHHDNVILESTKLTEILDKIYPK